MVCKFGEPITIGKLYKVNKMKLGSRRGNIDQVHKVIGQLREVIGQICRLIVVS